MGRGGPRKIESVAASAISHPVGFGFGGTQGCFLLAVGNLTSVGNFMLGDEENGVGATDAHIGRAVLSHALG